MDLSVAHGACLVFGRLIVGRSRRRACCAVHVRSVTTQTEKVDIVDLQQSRISRAVRRVARQATFIRLYRCMLEDEGPHRIRVAFRADRKLTCRRPYLMARLRTVRIMAVTALNETNIDTMAVRPRELRLLLRVAPEAQLGLRLHQHEVNVVRFVRAVTTGTAYAVGQVFRFREILGLKAGLMTLSTDCRGLGRAQCLESDDLGDIASAINMCLSGAMAGLTAVLIALQEGSMWCSGEVFLPDLLVAGLADVRLGVLTAGRNGKCG